MVDVIQYLKTPLRIALVRAAAWRRAHLPETRFVGITGSCGKTTTKELLSDCLALQASCTRSRESNNSIWSVAKTILRTPPRRGFAVAELGTNGPGDIAPMAALLQPHLAMVTCIAPAHTEGLGSLEHIAREKSELLRAILKGGTAVLLREEPYFELLRGAVPAHARLVTVSMTGNADYTGTLPDPAQGVFEIIEAGSNERQRISLSIPGRPQMINSLFAAAAARALGVQWPDIIRALEQFTGLPMRWQKREHAGITVINDAYNANPASMRMALETFAGVRVPGGKWLVFGGMRELGEREREEHLALGRLIARGDWAGLISVGELGGLIAGEARNTGFPVDRIESCAGTDGAARAVAGRMRAGDAVLIKASRAFKLERVEARWIHLLKRGLTNLALIAALMPVGVSPARASTNATPELSARAAFVEQADTGAVLFEREADTRVPIASLAKLMTGLLVCKYADPEDTLVISPYALSQLGRMGGFRAGEEIRVGDVLGLTIVESSNDGATALAEYFAAKRGLLDNGRTDKASDPAVPECRFVEAMNREAGDLGLSNTHFANPHGMDDEAGYISARDAAVLFKAFIQYPLLLKIAGTREYKCTSADGTIRHRAMNTNLMLDPARGILAGKTGTTTKAGEHLVVLWEPAGSPDRRIIVVLGSTNRYADTKSILGELPAPGTGTEP